VGADTATSSDMTRTADRARKIAQTLCQIAARLARILRTLRACQKSKVTQKSAIDHIAIPARRSGRPFSQENQK